MRVPCVLIGVALLGSLSATSSAFAAYPGQNGRIVFVGLVPGAPNAGTRQLYTINPNGTERRAVPNTAGLQVLDPVWSPDGERIAFSGTRVSTPDPSYNDANRAIYLINANGSGRLLLSRGVGVRDTGPTWSPNSSWIAFSRSAGGAAQIHLINSGNWTVMHQLTWGGADNLEPAWSPDGEEIAYVSRSTEDYLPRIWAMRSDGLDKRKVTTVSARHPDWSPLGRQLLFTHLDDDALTWESNWSVRTIKREGWTMQSYPGALGVGSGAWSPDGTSWVGRHHGVDGFTGLRLLPADGSTSTVIPNTLSTDQQPDWQPIPGAPRMSVRPSIIGTPQLGARLRADSGRWVGRAWRLSVTWKRCNAAGVDCQVVEVDTMRRNMRDEAYYTPVVADSGHRLRIGVWMSNAYGYTMSWSAPSATIQPYPPMPRVLSASMAFAHSAALRPKR